MHNPLQTGDTLAGTIGGTVLVILMNLSPVEILHTASLAAIGAGVSFGVSLLLKWLIARVKRKR